MSYISEGSEKFQLTLTSSLSTKSFAEICRQYKIQQEKNQFDYGIYKVTFFLLFQHESATLVQVINEVNLKRCRCKDRKLPEFLKSTMDNCSLLIAAIIHYIDIHLGM